VWQRRGRCCGRPLSIPPRLARSFPCSTVLPPPRLWSGRVRTIPRPGRRLPIWSTGWAARSGRRRSRPGPASRRTIRGSPGTCRPDGPVCVRRWRRTTWFSWSAGRRSGSTFTSRGRWCRRILGSWWCRTIPMSYTGAGPSWVSWRMSRGPVRSSPGRSAYVRQALPRCPPSRSAWRPTGRCGPQTSSMRWPSGGPRTSCWSRRRRRAGRTYSGFSQPAHRVGM
jgi:hypothetical protein